MKNLYYRYAALYNFSYMAIGALVPLIGQYLQYMGFNGTQIGIITSTGTCVAIFASAFWGTIYNRSCKKHEIIIILCMTASAICFVLKEIDIFVAFAVIFGIMYFFQAPVMSLTDAFTVQSGYGFGGLRAWGALGFSLGTFLTGIIVDIFGMSLMFWIYSGSFLISSLIIYTVKKKSSLKINKNECDKKAKRSYYKLLQNKRLRNLIICAFFWGGTNVANNTYFSFLYVEGGGTVAGVGIAMLLMVGSEVPFMTWCEKLSSKFTMEKIVLAAMIISSARFVFFGMGLPWWGLILLSFTQGAVNGILLIEFVRYSAKLASDEYKSLAVSAYYVIGSNLSTILCQIIGGIILDCCGATGVYMFFGVFNLCGVILYIGFRLNKTVSD